MVAVLLIAVGIVWICSCSVCWNIGYLRGMRWTERLYKGHFDA